MAIVPVLSIMIPTAGNDIPQQRRWYTTLVTRAKALFWSAMHTTGRTQSIRWPYPGRMWPSAGPSKGTKAILVVIADELSVKRHEIFSTNGS